MLNFPQWGHKLSQVSELKHVRVHECTTILSRFKRILKDNISHTTADFTADKQTNTERFVYAQFTSFSQLYVYRSKTSAGSLRAQLLGDSWKLKFEPHGP